MARELVFDIEANGLLDTATECYCIVIKDIIEQSVTCLVKEEVTKDRLSEIFLTEEPPVLIGHNIIAFDIPFIKKFYGIDLINIIPHENIVDTYVWSRVLNPDRELPKGCPTTIRSGGILKRIGAHGLDSWGWRVGERKIDIDDWATFSDDIVKRCEMDVEINERVYFSLLKEAGL